jgi:hypothetical protein
MVAARPLDWGPPAEVREILRRIDAYERVSAADVALLRAHLTPAEITQAEDRWGISLDQLLVPPVDPEDAPWDDEPETPEEAAAVAEALAGIERGEPGLTTPELLRSLGL